MIDIKNLLNRLRGKKRSPKEILQRHMQQIKSEPPPTNSVPEQMQPTPIENSSEVFVLDIKNEADMQNYLARLKNLAVFEKFLSLPWFRTRLDRAKKILTTLESWNDFANEEFNFKLAKKVCAIAGNMLNNYRDAKTAATLDETSRENLRADVEDYLASIGLTKKIFNVGDAFDEWADLGMEESYEVTYTDNRALNAMIAVVEIQPHIIFYRGESDEPEQLIFGGSCRVYKFKED